MDNKIKHLCDMEEKKTNSDLIKINKKLTSCKRVNAQRLPLHKKYYYDIK